MSNFISSTFAKMRRIHWFFWLMGFSVLLGAWSAHGLEGWISEDKIDSFKVGVQYQMIHGLVLLFIEWNSTKGLITTHKIRVIQNVFLAGIFCFSGSIYVLTLNEYWSIYWIKWLWPVTPIGGVLLMAAWFWGGYQFFKTRNEK